MATTLMTAPRVLIRLLSVHRYGGYVAYVFNNTIFVRLLRSCGVSVGKNVEWLGRPIITLAGGSTIAIGDNCVLCSESTQTALGVNHPIILRTLCASASIEIGCGVKMSGTSICAATSIHIGDRTMIGANVMIADTDFHPLDASQRGRGEDLRVASAKPIVIESDCFLGANSIIMKGVVIGRGAVVGAGSVVTKDVPVDGIVAGNPSKIIGYVKKENS
jgi:acetyltransferase-like isoleucine patch superfamily enzyme